MAAPLRSIVLSSPVRTAIGTFNGTLKDMPAPDLGSTAIAAAVERAGLRADEIRTVVMGHVVHARTKINPSRQAAVHAGLPATQPAMKVKSVGGAEAPARSSRCSGWSAGARGRGTGTSITGGTPRARNWRR